MHWPSWGRATIRPAEAQRGAENKGEQQSQAQQEPRGSATPRRSGSLSRSPAGKVHLNRACKRRFCCCHADHCADVGFFRLSHRETKITGWNSGPASALATACIHTHSTRAMSSAEAGASGGSGGPFTSSARRSTASSSAPAHTTLSTASKLAGLRVEKAKAKHAGHGNAPQPSAKVRKGGTRGGARTAKAQPDSQRAPTLSDCKRTLLLDPPCARVVVLFSASTSPFSCGRRTSRCRSQRPHSRNSCTTSQSTNSARGESEPRGSWAGQRLQACCTSSLT